MNLERRALTAPLEVRAADAGRTAKGYAALFNSEALIAGQFREVIAPGAFADSLRTRDILALYGHDRNRVLGRTSAGTLRLAEDDTGLSAEIDLADTTDGRDLAVQLERGDIKGMSFGFRVADGGDVWDFNSEPPLRTVRQAELFEVTATADPAYEDTTLALRSLEASKEDRKEIGKRNADAAKRRIEERKAVAEQKFRKLSPGA